MNTVTYKIDTADITRWEKEQLAILTPMNLTMTPSFVAVNYLQHKFGQWFDDTTADGWAEMRDGWMDIAYCGYGVLPLSVQLEFHSKNEATLFKLTFGGAA